MNEPVSVRRPTSDAPARSRTLVWIDAREAVIVRSADGEITVEHIGSDVPAHVRSTGHVRHDPSIRHGGGRTQTALDAHRVEHLERFTASVAGALPTADDLTILGSGPVHEQLARLVRASDRRHHRVRDVECAAAPRRTDRQLAARLQRSMGHEPRRRSVGAYRWGRAEGDTSSRWPRRVTPKPHRADDEASP
jgi:hypothetical protein